MKTTLFLLKWVFPFSSFLYFQLTVLAQGVGINTGIPDNSSVLDVSSVDKGVLIPRVALNASNIALPVTSPATGLLVYNTDTAGVSPNKVFPGFYYWGGSEWKALLALNPGINAWMTGGNTGTISGTHFIGTIDAQPFDIRTNNTVKTRITTKGQIEMVNTGRSVFVGELAGANDDLSNNDNVFVGYQAGNASTSGGSNTAVGRSAYFSSTNGDHNTAVGNSALYSNTNGASNSAIGFESLFANTKGYNNTAIGWGALRSNTTAVNNVAMGFRALYTQSFSNSDNTWNSFNVGIGGYALYSTQATATGNGISNTAIGHDAGYNNTTGSYNTYLGRNAGANGGAYSNSTAIGADATVTGDNQVHVGNTSIGSIKGQVGFSTYSDQRFKRNVTENVPGLVFIQKLRPVTYTVDIAALNAHIGNTVKKDNATIENLQEKEKVVYSGFLAQEVEQSAKETGYDFSGVDKPQNENDTYGLRYGEFTVPLVKAVQEQQEMIETQQIEIHCLRAELESIKEKLTAMER